MSLKLSAGSAPVYPVLTEGERHQQASSSLTEGDHDVKTIQIVPIVLLAGVLSATSATAQSIYAGSASGSYTNDFCPEVESKLKSAYFEHRCATSEGTGDNVDKVLADPKSVGFGQLDVVAARMMESPGKLAMVDQTILDG
jgi:hypothetical protein